MLKTTLKKLIPGFLMPFANKVYVLFFGKPRISTMTEEQYQSLNCLKCNISYNKYGGYCTPKSSMHRPATQTINSQAVYEPNTIQYIISHCKKGDIIHAGAFFGDFLPALSAHCHKQAKIWAFEPNPENYQCASITLQINNIKNVTLTNAGLGEKQQKLWMKTKDNEGKALGGASRIVKNSSVKTPGVDMIQIVAIDQSIDSDRNISVLHLDVEGHEKQALIGAIETIKRCLPIIILEVFSKRVLLNSDWFKDNILSLGYKETSKVHGNVIFVCDS